MKIDNYKTLTYEEDERINNPIAFGRNGKGNRKCQHIIISNPKQVKTFLEKYELTGIADEMICISILWRFPRKEFNEKDMWVTMSGITYNTRLFRPKTFVIADNIVTEEDQSKAKEIIDTLNKWNGIEVSYEED
jgi:hypothetical protein